MTSQVSVSKFVDFAVLMPPDLSIRKFVDFAVLMPPDLSVRKFITYAVLEPPPAPVDINIAITGVQGTSGIGTVVGGVPGGHITGVQGTGTAHALGAQSSAFTIIGVQGTAIVGNLLVTSGPNFGTGTITGVQAISHAGAISKQLGPQLTGVQAISQIGQPTVLIFKAGFRMSSLSVISIPSMESDSSVSMRVSFDKGASWGNARLQSMGKTGEYYTNLQWRRLGYGRSIVVSLDWSSPRPCALANLYIQTTTENT